MSIRIGNTVYIEGMAPIEVSPRVADEFERITSTFQIGKEGLDDLIANKPGGIIRVKKYK